MEAVRVRLLAKSISFIALAAIIVLAVALPAFAGGYVNWDTVSGLGGQGTSPHGGYSTNTVKCQVCHAPHYASKSGQVLLQSTVANACTYCHVNTLSAYVQVYGSNPANYSGTDFPNAHNEFTVGAVEKGVTCTKCHQVHAASNIVANNAYLASKLLISPQTWVPGVNPALGVPLPSDTSQTALTKFCEACHFTVQTNPGEKFQFGVFWTNEYAYGQGLPGPANLTSHVATLAHANYTNPAASTTTKVAWGNSDDCSDCHSSGFGGAAWPHYTTGSRFLESAVSSGAARSGAASDTMDGICLGCHRSPGGSQGVGVSF